MLNVSSEFIEAAKSNVRSNKMRVTLNFKGNENIAYTAYPPLSQQAADTTVTPIQLKDGINDFHTVDWTRLSSGDTDMSPKQWVLGQSKLAPYDDIGIQYGYWDSESSDAAGYFAHTQKEDGVLIQFNNEINIPFINMVFDATQNQYAKQIDVYYQSASPLGVVNKIEISNDAVDFIYNTELYDVYRIWIVPKQWSEAYEPFRVSEISFFADSLVFGDGMFYEIKVIESIEQEGDKVSAGLNRAYIKFNNFNKEILLSYAVNELEILIEFAFEVYEGEYEWIPMGTFYAVEWVFEKNGNIVIVNAVDILELMSRKNIEHPFLLLGYQYISRLIENNIINQQGMKNIKLSLDALVAQWYTIFPHVLSNDTRSVLLEIAVNMGCFLYIDRNNNISFKPYELYESVDAITQADRYQGKAKTTPITTFNNINVISYSPFMLTSPDIVEFYNGTVQRQRQLSGTVYVRVDYSSSPADVSSLSATGTYPPNTEINYYSDYAIVGLKENGTFNISISGYAVIYDDYLSSFQGDYRSSNDIEYNMRYITDDATRNMLAQILQNKLKRMLWRYDIPLRGNPAIETGDAVTYIDDNNNEKYAVLIRAEYVWDGGLRANYLLKGEK